MGIFGLGEILFNIDKRETQGSILETPKSLLPTAEDWKRSTLPIARGSLLGFGIAPMIFRPIAGTIYLAFALALIILPFYRAIRRKKPPQAF